MAHNSRIRSLGLWTPGSTVSDAEFEALDEAQFESINGDDGGTWAPGAAIIIGGSGLQVTGAATFDNITATGTSRYKLASRSLTKVMATTPFFDPTNAKLAPPNGVATLVNSQFAIDWPLDVPNRSTITSIALPLNPGATLPASQPSISLVKIHKSTRDLTTIGGSTQDAQVSAAAYDALHTLTHNVSPPEQADRSTYDYYARILTESGAGASTGTIFYQPTVVFTTTEMADSAA